MFTVKMNQRVKSVLAVMIVIGVLKIFIDFAPLSYGMPFETKQCEKLKWRSGWDFNCNNTVLQGSIRLDSDLK